MNLLDNFKLVPLDIENNELGYSYLYKNGIKISNEIFRKGGLCSGFKNGYCNLIHYSNVEKGNVGQLGKSCIINSDGKIVLIQDNLIHYPYHLKGNIGYVEGKYYNLLTSELIVDAGSNYGSLRSKDYLFIENNYNKNYQKGVWKINWITCEVEVFEK